MDKRILFTGAPFAGKPHDSAIFKSLFARPDFSTPAVRVDPGFAGIDKQVQAGDLFIPFKASKHHPLDGTAKEDNGSISSIRVKAEHAIANPEAFFILRTTSRRHRRQIPDCISDVCTQLANFRLDWPKINICKLYCRLCVVLKRLITFCRFAMGGILSTNVHSENWTSFNHKTACQARNPACCKCAVSGGF